MYQSINLDTRPIAGILINYFFVCKRKLWLFAKWLGMEHRSELVELGKLIDEEFYKHQRKHVLVDGVISIDFTRRGKYIHEIKKAPSISEADRWQVKYYLYYLKHVRGIDGLKGIIDYPKLRKRVTVELTPEDEKELHRVICQIECLLQQPSPPKPERKKICKKCAYFEFCFS